MLSAEPTGKLDPETRAALKAYQETNGLKATGTLNQTTLEKMGDRAHRQTARERFQSIPITPDSRPAALWPAAFFEIGGC
ncbi:MAG: peptidoglycan-binding protein [Acidobacteria bacterium]|nr:peptidoglycan-binding protein [Acidobacteriota bacterium]